MKDGSLLIDMRDLSSQQIENNSNEILKWSVGCNDDMLSKMKGISMLISDLTD